MKWKKSGEAARYSWISQEAKYEAVDLAFVNWDLILDVQLICMFEEAFHHYSQSGRTSQAKKYS